MKPDYAQRSSTDQERSSSFGSDAAPPAIQLPKGGGAIRGIGEKFAANPVTGTGSMSVSIATSPGRSGFGPQLSLSYDSGAGNGPFGFGWTLSLPSITRKTDKGLPQYCDAVDSDVFILSSAEDLVPVYRQDPDGTWVAGHPGFHCDADGFWVRDPSGRLVVHEDELDGYRVRRYRPRIEGLFARIERWNRIGTPGDVHWRSISKDNILTLYGYDPNSRVADPLDASRIFSWLICESRDDKGNGIRYLYKEEDGKYQPQPGQADPFKQAHQVNRGLASDSRRTAQRYLQRVLYGSRKPLLDAEGRRPRNLSDLPNPPSDTDADWLFEVRFDYGELDEADPTNLPENPWFYRPDAFSNYRSGFEVRTCRRCERVLMLHHIPDKPALEGQAARPGYRGVVRSTEFTYDDEIDPDIASGPVYSFLKQVVQTGWKQEGDSTTRRSLPPVEFTYTAPIVQEVVEEVDPASLENLPIGLDGSAYRWTDLHGEGIPGILTEQAGAWFYKRNWSPIPQTQPDGSEAVKARFAPLETVALKPNVALNTGAEFMDLAGDGQPDIVVMEGPAPGLYEHDGEEGWQSFRPFTSCLNRDFRDPNLRFVDLDGDGRADALITENDAFVWHASLAEEGFAPARTVAQALDEEKGPRVVFADGTQSIYLADLSGDGLADIVRIRNGEVCYWPNLGYCRFGAKVTMDNAPRFDHPDQFDHTRIRLADIDGSGTTDIIYLHHDGVRLHFNQSGNSWSQPQVLKVFPRVDDLVSIVPVDLLGNGTTCLVWSSPMPGDTRCPMRYVNLMGDRKPHLLVKSVNNLGAETRVDYTPSTKFYLQDKNDGKPWVTRLPFPVHVVERVETWDYVSRNRFVTRYAYHHGYFDGEEREFHGFGMVEQYDTEAFEDYVDGVQAADGAQDLAPELNQPPVTTRTWYHTGALLAQPRILHQHRHQYYGQEQQIPDPVLPSGLSSDELRECVRALKGLPLRQEIYSYDGSAEEEHPYTVTENNFEIRWLQPRGSQRHGVFFPIRRESISLNYERNPDDPRISHAFGLDLDEYGNACKSCSVVYGRQITDASLPIEVRRDQQYRYITYEETDYTPDITQTAPVEAYRLRVPFESRNYEITGVAPAGAFFQLEEIKNKITAAASIDYEIIADGVSPQKRLLAHSRTLFLDNTLNPLPLGQWDSLGLGHQSYKLAFTPGVTAAYYAGKVSDVEFTAAGYVHFAGDTNWWLPSGTDVYPANPRDAYYLPIGAKDPFGLQTIATIDRHVLLIEKVEIKQAAWNVVTADNDYRVLGPVLMTDPNGNRSAVEHDELGMVVTTAVMGKAGSADGDTLADPTTRMEYELFNWANNRKPNYVHTFAREQHGAANPRWQESYVYSNGSGGVAMVKAQAHPGKAFRVNPDGSKAEVDSDPRWVGNGRTVLNNKGKPVKQYEPYFSTTHEYEEEKVLREIGVTPVLFYDPVGRIIRTVFPNGTFAKVEFNPWLQKVFDANDTVKQSPWYADRGSPDPAVHPEPLDDPEHRAAWLAAKHADTPGIIHFDSLGRSGYAVSDYGGGKTAAVRSESDLTGRYSKLFDQQQREVASGFVGMAGTPIVGDSAEKGRRWTFQNVLGALVKTWDEHGRQFRVEYDTLHRPAGTFVQQAGQAEILFNYVVYGDRLGEAIAKPLNLLGTAHLIFDQAGLVRVPQLDFKDNPKSVERVLAKDYQNDLDWSALPGRPDVAAILATADPALETAEVFSASSMYDALNRPTRVTLPDGTIIVPTYNEANFVATLKAQIRGQDNFIEFLKAQEYDAKGQRQFAHYGNDVFTRYFYDPQTFRLINLLTYQSGVDPQAHEGLQDLDYCYDPVGNITQIRDDAQQTHYFNNAVVKPESLYEYDAVYQLVRATGRELAGGVNDAVRTHTDLDPVQLPHQNNVGAVRTYTEEYEYDLLGNIKLLKHRFQSQAGIGGGWTRHYRYTFEDVPSNRTNRLTSTSLPGDPAAGPYTSTYDYDAYGNMTRMPHLETMDWNFMEQLRRVDLGGGGTAYYVYGLGGRRLRKVIERSGNLKLEWIFLGAVMIFRRRRRTTNDLRLERWTVHISDNTGHIAQVDTKVSDDDNEDPTNPLNTALIRYQYGNHLASAALETDDNGNPISYEEYHPYGTTAYRSARSGTDLSLKRYRFSGKERDKESGLHYSGKRYYAAWLGRWASSDPVGFADGLNLHVYCHNNPIGLRDPDGTTSKDVTIGKPSESVIHDLFTNDDSARARLENFYRNKTFPDPNNANGGVSYVPGSLYWNEEKQQNWGTFDPVPEQIEEVTVKGRRKDKSAADANTNPTPASKTEGSVGASPVTQAGPSVEKYIWHGRNFRDRGFTLEHLYNDDIGGAISAKGDNRQYYDVETNTHVKQIKSSNGNTQKLEAHASKATRDAGKAIGKNPTGSMSGKKPQAVVITPTDAHASAGSDIRAGYDKISKPVTNSVPPEHVRGLPGGVGVAARGLTFLGAGVSAFSLGMNLGGGDYAMAGGDAISTVGGGLEVYAILTPGATVAGLSAMTVGLAAGGIGIAVTSGISMSRAADRGDSRGAIAGFVGTAAGLSIAAGAAGLILGAAAAPALFAAAPVLIGAGIVAALAVGAFHVGRHFGWWD
ncbi:SpvB/TcaC N-terminal domain-containing protein [Rhodococcus sp. M8-35]|uniref:SpvB/TcaC N-terminal domain-containing protein n=1 Tax=Rhodococcus sp. M8-35 TaxID=3058401 RepID=UPI002ECFBFCA